MATIGQNYYNMRYGTTLYGTDEAGGDSMHGYAGNDTFYGGLGNDWMYGGSGNDYFRPTNATFHSTTTGWGNDVVYGGTGNDTIDFVYNTHTSYLYGEDGDDMIFGGPAYDLLVGGNGNDWLSGGGSGDNIFGDAGVDDLWGGDGNDNLYGGADGDWISGGGGTDFFDFSYGNTGLTWATADTIRDFNREYDWIDGPFAGTSYNYRETTVAYNAGFDAARAWAATQINGTVKYAFATDGVDGYLFGDLNNDGWMDSGIELKGVSHVAQFMASDIL